MTEDREKENYFVDSNIWLYSFIETDIQKSAIAKSVVGQAENITVSTQVINEVCVNLIKKAGFSEDRILKLITSFYNKYNIIEINEEILGKASLIREKHNFSFWDSLILASALYSDCEILYSEDMQDNFLIQKTKIRGNCKTIKKWYIFCKSLRFVLQYLTE